MPVADPAQGVETFIDFGDAADDGGHTVPVDTWEPKKPEPAPSATPPPNGTAEDEALAKTLLDAIKSYVNSERFGLEFGGGPGIKGQPRPANPKNDPRHRVIPGYHGGKVRETRRLTTSRMLQHLRGERALFDYATHDRLEVQYAIDIDGEPGGDYQTIIEWAKACFAKVLPSVTPFAEKSRGGNGVYLRFGVKYPPSTDGPARRRAEQALHEKFTEAFVEPPAGAKYDRVIGTTSYVEDNPNYDPALARSIAPDTGRQMDLVEVDEVELGLIAASPLAIDHPVILAAERDGKLWVRKTLADAVAEDFPQLAPGIADRPIKHDWSDITEAEVYERHKSFYGIGRNGQVNSKAKFNRREELEPHVTRHGQLGTSPCYGAWRGDRPDNLMAYLFWREDGEGVVDPAILKEVIGTAWKKAPPAPEPTTHAENIDDVGEPPTGPGLDELIFADPTADRWSRYSAAVRIAMRRARGNTEQAEAIALAMWESAGGPSDGPRHPERIERVQRMVSWWAATFDPSKAGSGGIWFDESDVMAMERKLRGRISREEMSAARFQRGRDAKGRLCCRRLTYDMLAWAACFVVKNATTGNRGEVPHKSIRKGLEHRGYRANGSTVTAMLDLLRDTDLIRWRWQGWSSRHTHHCRQVVLIGKIMRPKWAEAAMGEDVWAARVPEWGFGLGMARPTPAQPGHHTPIPPIDNGIGYTTLIGVGQLAMSVGCRRVEGGAWTGEVELLTHFGRL